MTHPGRAPGLDLVGRQGSVRQLRRHCRRFLAHFSAPPPRRTRYALRRAHADRVLIGAWNPML